MPFRLIFPRWRITPRATNHLGLVFKPGLLAAAVIRCSPHHKPKLVNYVAFTEKADFSLVRQWLNKKRLAIASVNFLLPKENYQLLSLETPAVPAAERAEAARWLVKEMVDFPIEEACIDCLVVPAPNGEGEGQSAWAVVAHRTQVRDWMKRLYKARLSVQSIDIAELALRNLLVLAPTPQACALLRLGQSGGTLVVVWQGELCIFRRLDDLNMSHFQIPDLQSRQAVVERLALEMQRTADAFERQFYGTSIERVWIEQSVPDIDLVQQLAPHVSLRLHAFSLADYVDIEVSLKPYLEQIGGADLLSVGAALRQVVTPMRKPQ